MTCVLNKKPMVSNYENDGLLSTAVLFGTRKLERFEENVGALQITPDQTDLDEIETANFRVQGARYPEAAMKQVGI